MNNTIHPQFALACGRVARLSRRKQGRNSQQRAYLNLLSAVLDLPVREVRSRASAKAKQVIATCNS